MDKSLNYSKTAGQRRKSGFGVSILEDVQSQAPVGTSLQRE